jgi:hypothetical protein
MLGRPLRIGHELVAEPLVMVMVSSASARALSFPSPSNAAISAIGWEREPRTAARLSRAPRGRPLPILVLTLKECDLYPEAHRSRANRSLDMADAVVSPAATPACGRLRQASRGCAVEEPHLKRLPMRMQ